MSDQGCLLESPPGTDGLRNDFAGSLVFRRKGVAFGTIKNRVDHDRSSLTCADLAAPLSRVTRSSIRWIIHTPKSSHPTRGQRNGPSETARRQETEILQYRGGQQGPPAGQGDRVGHRPPV